MLSYNYLLDLALILLTTKALGIITKKFKMPFRNRETWSFSIEDFK